MTHPRPVVIPRESWTVLKEGAVKRISFTAPDGHPIFIFPEWLTDDGRFMGRLGCPAPCRVIYEDVRLEGYSEEALRG